MKKLILILVVLVAGLTLGQIEMNADGGFYWADSLYQTYIDTAGVDDTTAASLTSSIDLSFNYEELHIVGIDTGATFTDSILVEYGTVRPAADVTTPGVKWSASDTIWNSVHYMRDSTGTNKVWMNGAAAHIPRMVDVSGYEMIRVRFANDITKLGTDTSVVWKFYGVFSRKK